MAVRDYGKLTQRCHWIPSGHLFRHRFDIGKALLISKRWEPIVPNDPIYLRLSFSLEFRMRHHRQVKRMYRRYGLSGSMSVPSVRGH